MKTKSIKNDMIVILLSIFIIVSGTVILTGCERNDYQHPLHRK